LIDKKTSKVPVKSDFFQGNNATPLPIGIKISNFTNDGVNFGTRNEFVNVLNRDISEEKYADIVTCIRDSWSLLKKFCKGDTSIELPKFIRRFKKGSKPFRKIFDVYDLNTKSRGQNRRTTTFFRLTSLDVPDRNFLMYFNSLWTVGTLPIKLREFFFKFKNNLLGLNVRVSHFNNQVDRGCTFCLKSNSNHVRPVPVQMPPPPPRGTGTGTYARTGTGTGTDSSWQYTG
jgi:hypothetical protein